MAFTFDFTNYRETGSARVDPGTYHARVKDFRETVSKADNVMFEVYLEITSGPYAGKQIIDRLPQTERAMFRSAAFLQALGVQIAKKRIALNPKSLIGRPVDILVEDGEPFNGRVKSEVREYLRATKPAAKAEPAADLPDEDDEPAAPAAEPAETASEDTFDVDALDIDDLDL
jgi:hypothetical protein